MSAQERTTDTDTERWAWLTGLVRSVGLIAAPEKDGTFVLGYRQDPLKDETPIKTCREAQKVSLLYMQMAGACPDYFTMQQYTSIAFAYRAYGWCLSDASEEGRAHFISNKKRLAEAAEYRKQQTEGQYNTMKKDIESKLPTTPTPTPSPTTAAGVGVVGTVVKAEAEVVTHHPEALPPVSTTSAYSQSTLSTPASTETTAELSTQLPSNSL